MRHIVLVPCVVFSMKVLDDPSLVGFFIPVGDAVELLGDPVQHWKAVEGVECGLVTVSRPALGSCQAPSMCFVPAVDGLDLPLAVEDKCLIRLGR